MALFSYTGSGEYLEGVPMRDLEPEDWERLDEDHQAVVHLSALYEAVEPPAEPLNDGEAT